MACHLQRRLKIQMLTGLVGQTQERVMMDQEENDRLERDLASAFSKFKNGIGGKAAVGLEKNYGLAYQALVRAGLRPQLKGKYRAF